MGYNISVDCAAFESAASAIEEYNTGMTNKMNSADAVIKSLFCVWSGEDALSYKNKWSSITASDSTYANLKTALKNHAAFLRSASKIYQTAQENAVSSANNRKL